MGALHPLIPDDIATVYADKGYWAGRSLSEYVADWASSTPAALAVWCGDVRFTYAELDAAAARLAGELLLAGVPQGANVMSVLGLRPHAAVATVACSRLGSAQAGMSSMQSAARCSNRMSALRPAALIIEADLLADADWREIWDSLAGRGVVVVMTVGEFHIAAPSGVVHLRYEHVLESGQPLEDHLRTGSTVSALITTGGTTGEPKTVMQFDDALVYASFYTADCAHLSADDIYVGVGPFGHIMTVYAIYIPLLLGATLVPLHGWSRGQDFVECVEQYGGTASMMTATHAYDLWALPDIDPVRLESLKVIVSAGKPDDFFTDLGERYGLSMLRCYGMSEVNLWVMARIDDEAIGNADGLACPGAEVRVVGEASGVLTPAGVAGELAVRSPGVGHGYYGRPDLTAEVSTEDGFFYSGDLATCSADGYIRIVGRSKEQIRRGGVNIVPKELDAILLAHPEVAEACVVGLPDDRLGEIVVAGLVAAPGCQLTLEGIRWYMQSKGVPPAELPDRIALLDAIPRNDLGRFNRNAVKDLLLASESL